MAAALLQSADAGAVVFATRAQALAEAFPGARIEPRSFVMTEAQAKAVSERARVKADSKLVTAWIAWLGDSLAGVAFMDSRTVRTMPGVFMVTVLPDTTLGKVEVLAFHEPPDYLPPARWLGLFERRRLTEGLWPRRDLRNLSGASLTARAVTESVRLGLAWYEVLVAPALAERTPGSLR